MCRRRTQSIINHQSHTHTAILKSLLLRHVHKCAYHTRGYRSLWNPIFHIERLQHFDTIFNMYLTCSSDTTDTLKKPIHTAFYMYTYTYIHSCLCTALLRKSTQRQLHINMWYVNVMNIIRLDWKLTVTVPFSCKTDTVSIFNVTREFCTDRPLKTMCLGLVFVNTFFYMYVLDNILVFICFICFS